MARRLLFVERSFPFKVELPNGTLQITRTQLPLTHARVRTCQASQGLTFEGGVIADLSRMGRTEPDVWWLNAYVMVSRATY